MNAFDLIQQLADAVGAVVNFDEVDTEALQAHEVRLAHQPHYPFEYSIRSVAGPDEIGNEDECPEHEGYLIGHSGCDIESEEQPKVIFIGEGEQLGYLSRDVASAVWH